MARDGDGVPDSDEELIARFRAGEAGAFDALARAHGRDVFVLAMGLLGNTEDAQDVAQDVLITLYAHLGRLRDPQALPAWLSRVCLNRCRMVLRRRRPTEAFGDRELAGDPRDGPDARLLGSETRIAVRQALLKLPRRQQQVFVLRHFAGRSIEETALALGCAQATVRVHLSRAVARLHEALSEKEGDDG